MSDEESKKETDEILEDQEFVDHIEKSIVESQLGQTVSLEQVVKELHEETEKDKQVKESRKNADYLGDAVYADYDGESIILKANDFDMPSDTIVLEPQVVDAFIMYAKRMGVIS